MNKSVVGFILGLIFGLGLIISGMSNPAKVLNFLDLSGTWDPSLAFVMGGAVIVTYLGYASVLKRKAPLFAESFLIPTSTELDSRLITGAALFGIGWGLGGYCPGPAFTSLPLAATGTLYFVPAMLAGMWAGRIMPTLIRQTSSP